MQKGCRWRRGDAMPPQDSGRERGWLREREHEGEGGCRTRRRLDAVSVDIYLLQHEKVAGKRRWYAKEKEVTAAKDNRYRRKMIGCHLYPLFKVPEEVSGNRCRLPFAKHGRSADATSRYSKFLPFIRTCLHIFTLH